MYSIAGMVSWESFEKLPILTTGKTNEEKTLLVSLQSNKQVYKAQLKLELGLCCFRL